LPITYKLKDLSNELIKGSFYIEELVETVKPDFFLINEIIRSKTINNKKIYFVSWKGYDDSFNSWIESEAIYSLKKKKKKKKKKVPLSAQFCDFILMLKSKDETEIKKNCEKFA